MVIGAFEVDTGDPKRSACCGRKEKAIRVGVYIADQQSIDLGMQHAREDLAKIAEWKANNHYQAIPNGQSTSTSKWMLPKEDASSDVQPVTMSY